MMEFLIWEIWIWACPVATKSKLDLVKGSVAGMGSFHGYILQFFRDQNSKKIDLPKDTSIIFIHKKHVRPFTWLEYLCLLFLCSMHEKLDMRFLLFSSNPVQRSWELGLNLGKCRVLTYKHWICSLRDLGINTLSLISNSSAIVKPLSNPFFFKWTFE